MITAVIVNHKTSGFLPGLIQSLRREGLEDILVCDSYSTPEERDAAGRLDGVRKLLFNDNPGYGASLNRGCREAGEEYLLLMNADVEVTSGSISLLKEALTDFDAVGPNFFWEREKKFLLPHPLRHSWKNELLQLTQPDMFLKKYLAHEWQIWEGQDPCPVDLLSGAAFMIRRSVFERLGGFDEGFFLYYEENDFFHRLVDMGMTAAAVPRSHFLHFHAPGRTPESDWFFRASKDYFEKKYFPSSYLQLRPNLQSQPVQFPAPVPLPSGGIARKGRHLLYSLFPHFIPAACVRDDADPADPHAIVDRLPLKTGFLALCSGHDIVETYSID